MTDLPPHDPHEDDLLLDAFDGDPDAIAAVAAEPRLTIALNEMRHHRDALRTTPTPMEPSVREASLAAAMSVFDDMAASRASAKVVASLSERRQRVQKLFRSFGIVAASAAAVVGILIIGPSFGDSSADSVATDAGVSATTTAAAAATTAPPDTAGGISQADLESAATVASTTAAPSRLAEAAAATEPAAEVADSTIARDELSFISPDVDLTLLECAVSRDIDTSIWVESTLVENEDDATSLLRFIVLLDTGLEIDVQLDPATCLFQEIGEPHIPRPPGG